MNSIPSFVSVVVASGLLLCSAAASASSADIEWPQEVTADEGIIVVYQPQPEHLQGNVLKGRAAMSLELKGRDDPIFGAFWFEAKIDNDTDAGIATIRDVKVTNVRWPDFRRGDLYEAIRDYQNRERRFGKVSEQLTPDTSSTTSYD